MLYIIIHPVLYTFLKTFKADGKHFCWMITLLFQGWFLEKLTAGPTATLLSGFVVYVHSVSVSFSQFCHSLDIGMWCICWFHLPLDFCIFFSSLVVCIVSCSGAGTIWTCRMHLFIHNFSDMLIVDNHLLTQNVIIISFMKTIFWLDVRGKLKWCNLSFNNEASHV